MSERWGRDRVLGLAPDASSSKAATAVATPAKWDRVGCAGDAVWGECRGSGARSYRVCVDLSAPVQEGTTAGGGEAEGTRREKTQPAFGCTCPSRKTPCKHALGLLLRWSDGAVPETEVPGWVGEWLAERARPGTAAPTVRKPNPKTAERREQRVDDGVAELDRWLRDQVTQGLAETERASYRLWDDAARRLIDAQAPGLANQIRSLAAIPHRHTGWPERLLAEYALLHLLTRAHQRRAELPEPLRQTVRSRIGFTIPQDEVLRGERVRDRWYVAGSVDSERDFLVTRRVWLRGQEAGRSALVLTFAAPGRPFDAPLNPARHPPSTDSSLVVGTSIDADLVFYPGAQPLRAIVAERHGEPEHEPPGGTTVRGLLDEYATALSLDPWLDRWPAVLCGVRPARGSLADAAATGNGRAAKASNWEGHSDWHLVDERGDALPLAAGAPWRLLAASGGAPITVAGEWTPGGLYPLSGWYDEGPVIL